MSSKSLERKQFK